MNESSCRPLSFLRARGPTRVGLAATWLALSSPAWAQQAPEPPRAEPTREAPPPPPPPPAPPEAPPPATPTLSVGPEGVVLATPDKQFQLKLGSHLQTDGRLFTEGKDKAGGNGFLIRRARPIVEGTLFGFADFRLMPDFAGGTAVLFDAYVDLHPLRELRLRVGKFKHPVGIERLQADTALVFIERALPTNFVPSRDLGAQLHGEALGGVLTYAFGVFNGAADTTNADTNLEDNVDLAARLWVQPFRRTELAPLKGLGLGFAASGGSQHGTLASTGEVPLRTTGQQTFFSYLTGATLADTVIADGQRVRWTPHAYYAWGPFGLLAEYVSSRQDVHRGAERARLTNDAWQLAASFVLFGGSASFDGVRPTRPLRPSEGSWGAVELAARYSALHIDPNTFPTFADPDHSASAASAWGAAVNWYLTSNTRLGVNLERTSFEGGATGGANRPTELLLLERLQVFW